MKRVQKGLNVCRKIVLLQGHVDLLGSDVANAEALTEAERVAGKILRTGERYSLTIRRVVKTKKSLIRLSAGQAITSSGR